MRPLLPTTGTVMPQPPGRMPHKAPLGSLRYPGGETLLARGTPPDPHAFRTAILRASGTTKRAAGRRASGATSGEGGN